MAITHNQLIEILLDMKACNDVDYSNQLIQNEMGACFKKVLMDLEDLYERINAKKYLNGGSENLECSRNNRLNRIYDNLDLLKDLLANNKL